MLGVPTCDIEIIISRSTEEEIYAHHDIAKSREP